MKRHALIRSSILAALVYATTSEASAADNLLPDPSFGHVKSFDKAIDDKGWMWHRISEPYKVSTDSKEKSVTLEGGRVFLHSEAMSVDASTRYDLHVNAVGNGMFSAEILWWKSNGLPAKPHRSIVLPPRRLPTSASTLKEKIRSPSNAAMAYVRFAVEDGSVTLKSPKLAASDGKLLLLLDAAAPGPKPQSNWNDLSGLNASFSVKESVRHSAESNSFVFDKPGANCVGAKPDAKRFDFETDHSAGAGRGEPFTVVIYSKLGGRSATGIVNKFGDLTKGGWSFGVEFDEFGLDRVSTLQQAKHPEVRTFNGFPGLAGQNDTRLNANDGKFHLYVVYLSGTGLRDGKVYFDGSDKSLPITPWPFGVLSSGTVVNDAPLRIGSFNKHGFRGEIGFIEIWSGSRLRDGMTPAQYSRFRFNDGSPVRARETKE